MTRAELLSSASPRRIGRTARLLLVTLLLSAVACDYPRDPEGTLHRVRGGVLRVGVMPAGPWIEIDDDDVRGAEADLVQELASGLDAQVAWQPGGESVLLDKLRHFELDLVIGGVTEDSPWRSKVALSKPVRVDFTPRGRLRHVWARPPGENAWIMHVDEFLAKRKHVLATVPVGSPEAALPAASEIIP
jgi:ABC-type amino acid transport substrate-binding protein